MKKIYRKLTEEQIKRGVIFSSCLSVNTTEEDSDRIHEVVANQCDRERKIELLLDDGFFNQSPWNYNIIRK